jgi:hypothetical protein
MTVRAPQPSRARPPEVRSPEEQEVLDQVDALVRRKFGGSYEAAFKAYGTPGAAGVNRSELLDFLKDADVGFVTRQVAAGQIIDTFDSDKNELMSFAEFQQGTGLE